MQFTLGVCQREEIEMPQVTPQPVLPQMHVDVPGRLCPSMCIWGIAEHPEAQRRECPSRALMGPHAQWRLEAALREGVVGVLLKYTKPEDHAR